jgi:SnoaL-like domain
MQLPAPPKNLDELIDRAAIADVAYAYAHGVDRRDWALYRSIFLERIDVDFFTWAGIRQSYAIDEWVAMVRGTLASFDSTQHTLTNLAITLDGDQAVCVANMTARHNLVVGGTQESQILGGYYTNRLVRTALGWKIAACALMITWEEGDRALFEKALKMGPRARVDVGMQGV